jgi:hypothetical protein
MKRQIKYILEVTDYAPLTPHGRARVFVKSFDHDADRGRGDGKFTNDPNDAKRFDNGADAIEFWQKQSKVRPLRPDGKPNRPLTAYTAAIEPVSVYWLFTIPLREGTVTWDVDAIDSDVKAGKFGAPVRIPTELIPPSRWDADSTLERDRVDWIKTHPEELDKPCYLVAAPEPGHFRCFVDGQHRVAARQELKLPEVTAYVVPDELERAYRVDQAEMARLGGGNLASEAAT